jgi:dTDP-glucose 4,6-dehydratase
MKEKKKQSKIKKHSEIYLKKLKKFFNLYQEGKMSLDELAVVTELTKEQIFEYFHKTGGTKVRLLICGGAGFIGSNFIHYVLRKYPNYNVINYDKLTYAGNLDNLKGLENNPHYKFIQGDIADEKKIDEIFSKEKPDFVINFAAETHVDRSIHGGAREFLMTNVIGVHTILEAVKKFGTKKFIQISTDETFGSVDLDEDRHFKEDSPFAPNVPYAAAKAGGDLMCRAYFKTHKVPVIVTHCSNNYGPYQFPEKMIPFFLYRAMANEKVPLYGDGMHMRDWIFVEDHCIAIDNILQNGVPGDVYNIGANQERHNIDVARAILKILGRKDNLIVFVDERPGHDRRYSIDTTKINQHLKWTPTKIFESTLPDVVDWYLNNQWWVEGIKKRGEGFNIHIKKS